MTLDEILSKIKPSGQVNGCAEWGGAHTSEGYAQVRYRGKLWNLHRLIYTLQNGPIGCGLVIRHKCDNPWCVEILHLEPGTQRDNINDAVERGRHKGPGNPETKPKCIQLFQLGVQKGAIAKELGVSIKRIRNILWEYQKEQRKVLSNDEA